jgi:hypothetical protein
MLRTRPAFAALIALLLLAGSAQAARALPTTSRGDHPLARRNPAARAKAARRLVPPAASLNSPAAAVPAAAADALASPRLLCLTGVVRTSDGRPCPGVCVFPANNPRHIAVTNAEGAFQLQVPARTAFSLQAELLGQGSSRVAIAGESAQPVAIVLGR